MQLSRKQVILISTVSGVVLLLTLAVVQLYTPGDGEPAEPTAAPTATVLPTATPEPTATPRPTDYQLPLVPRRETPWPTADPAGAFVPQVIWPAGTAGPLVRAGDGRTRDILAVGLREGRVAALLLLRFWGDSLTVAVLPAGETPLAGEGVREQGEEAAALAEAILGRPCEGWMALDLRCLDAVLSVTGPLGEAGTELSSSQGVLSLAMDAVTYAQRAPLLKLPALKRAVGDSFRSNLSVWELWTFFWTVRKGVSVRGLVAEEGAQNFFRESS